MNTLTSFTFRSPHKHVQPSPPLQALRGAQRRHEMDLMMAKSIVRRLRNHFTVRTRPGWLLSFHWLIFDIYRSYLFAVPVPIEPIEPIGFDSYQHLLGTWPMRYFQCIVYIYKQHQLAVACGARFSDTVLDAATFCPSTGIKNALSC